MCGIAGIFSATKIISESDRISVQSAGHALKHRGPDDCREINTPHFHAVHTRLSIIDIKSGHQPMIDTATGNIIVFNGEIYNYLEIKQDLIDKGIKFETSSDTEVLLKGYSYYGSNIVNFLNGMFSFVIHNKYSNSIFAARDRFGEKPFYYFTSGPNFFFASEITALKSFSNCPTDISEMSLLSYFTFGYIEGPGSFYKGISQLAPGSYIEINGSETINESQYFTLNWECQNEINPSDEEIFHSLRESIKLRLRSDVPVASFLSGGIDSTIITAIAQEISNQPLKTYTFGMLTDAGELPLAKHTAKLLGTDHKEVLLDYNFTPEDILKIIKSLDMPLADSAVVPVYELSRLVSQDGIKVVLSGEGGDELYGGYPWYKQHSNLRTKVKNLFYSNKRREIDYLNARMIFDEKLLCNVFSNNLFSEYLKSIRNDLHHTGLTTSGKIAFDYKHFLAWDLLPKVDRMSMAHSLEVRVPFLDHNLVEMWACISDTLKIKDNDTKIRIKQFALNKNLIDSRHLIQPKTGLNLPLNQWVRRNKDLLVDTILCGNAISKTLFGKNNIENWIASVHNNINTAGWTRDSQRLWSLFVLDSWLQNTQFKA